MDHPTAGDYAYAAAHDARQIADRALATEQSNRARIEAQELRLTILEKHLGLTEVVDAGVKDHETESRRILVHPSMIGGVEVPEGFTPHIEGGAIVFRKDPQQ